MGIDFILFDLYGTLIDVETDEEAPEFWVALAEVLKPQCIKGGPQELRRAFSSALRDELSRLPVGFVMENVLRRVLGAIGAGTSRDAVRNFASTFRSLSTKQLSLRTYTSALLAAVRASGCKIGIVSNTEGVLTRPDIDRFPVLQDVSVTLLSSEVGLKKPDPKIFEIAMERLHVAPSSGIFVGDNLQEDIIGALGAGLRCVYIRNNRENFGRPFVDPRVTEANPELDSVLNGLKAQGWDPGEQRRQ